MNVKPIASLTYAETAELARAAADRGEPCAEANPFEAGTTGHLNFERLYVERERDIVALVES
jgi:hypothetical protein